MAKKKSKTPKKSKGKKKRAVKKISWRSQMYMIFSLVAGAIFLPTTVLLLVGMLPTIVAAVVDRRKKKTLAITVGALNLAGCTPFLLELWVNGHVFEGTFAILSDPMAIIVMYSAAGVGYLIDWSMTGIVSKFLFRRGISRQDSIAKRQDELVKRWGKGVTGTVPLDEQGFPLEDLEPRQDENPENQPRLAPENNGKNN